MTAATALVWFSIGAAAFVLLIFVLGTLIEWYHKHKLLAWILIIGLVLSVLAYGVHR